MKKVFVLLIALVTIVLTSCGYSKEDVSRARNEGYQEGYKDGYNEAEYYAEGEMEKARNEIYDTIEDAYDHGYDAGYDAGYHDGLEETGLIPDSSGIGRIEKPKD